MKQGKFTKNIKQLVIIVSNNLQISELICFAIDKFNYKP